MFDSIVVHVVVCKVDTNLCSCNMPTLSLRVWQVHSQVTSDARVSEATASSMYETPPHILALVARHLTHKTPPIVVDSEVSLKTPRLTTHAYIHYDV